MTDEHVGQPAARREDVALLTGRAEFTDDVDAPGQAHLAFVRADHGHADLVDVDLGPAEAVDDVIATYDWDDLAASDAPCVLPVASDRLDCDVPGHPVLARDRIRYEGQPVAAVLGEDRYAARDGARAVEVDVRPREAVVTPDDARDPQAPTIFEDAPDNVAVTLELGDAGRTREAFDDADNVVAVDLVNNRLIPSAIEPRAALAEPPGRDGQLTVTMTSQSPHGHRRKLAHTLGLAERDIRVVAPDVGGGFGHKGHHHPGEAMAAWAALELGRPVKWVATRSANFRAGAHGRDHVTHAELAVGDDGRFRGLRAETDAGVGGFGLGGGPAMPGWYGRLLSSQYAIPAIHCETRAVFTNTAPVHSYRGAGRPEAIYVTERLVNAAARELGFDPVELRRRNLIGADAFPYETPVGATYDSGDYEPALDAGLNSVDAEDLVDGSGTIPAAADEDGRYRGLGLACYVESTGGGMESGVVRVHPDGGVAVYAGTHSHGQGHETTYAQIVADALGVDPDRVTVHEGDTERVPKGTGTFGSRSAITGGNAVRESAETVREKARAVAAAQHEVEPDEVAVDDGTFHVAGDPDDAIDFEEVASAAYGRSLPEDVDPGLEATTFWEQPATAYAFGTHAAVVAVDPETGAVDVEEYVAVDDCGERINPGIVEGQVEGGVAQGIGQALYEQARYDEEGHLVTDSLMEYTVPRAGQLPDVETHATVTPSPTNELGVKGIGEAGTIAAPPAVVNAVLNALSPLEVDSLDMPLTDETVWEAVRDADAD